MATAVRVAALESALKSLSSTFQDKLAECQAALSPEVKTVPALVKETLLANFSIDGVTAVTRSDIDHLMERFTAALDERLNRPTTVSESTPISMVATSSPSSAWKTWSWGGRIHMVPEGWKLPRPSFKAFYLLWYHGDGGLGVQPFRFLRTFDVCTGDWQQVSKAKGLIGELERIATSQTPTLPPFSQLSKSALCDVFVPQLYADLYPSSPTNQGDVGIGTLYNRYRLKRKIEQIEKEIEPAE